MQKGFSASYDKWTSYRECYDDDEYVSSDDEEGGEGYDNMNDADDDFDEMFDNIGQNKWGNNWKTSGESSSTRDKDLESLRRLLDDSNQDLYKGCKNYSNVRLGLATDGFNPFSNLSSLHSTWPVFLVPYNLPPWKCMKDPFMLMSMLIPGPTSPGDNINVYLQPLIDELNDLWNGVDAYDAHKKETFLLRAALLWTINDFPAYGMLSGWSVKGYNACPTCMNDTSSHYLTHSKKVCYMGHRRFLPMSNRWRKDTLNFDGKIESREPIIPKSEDDVLHDVDCFINGDFRRFGIVKYVTESVIATLFNISGKTKYRWKSRKDLMEKGLKESLHLQEDRNSFIMPMACYHLTNDEKQKILDFLKSVKFLDGFASNISRCIKEEEFQLSHMKSHDFYVFIQQVFPLSIKGSLTREVRLVLYELSEFIQILCARNTYLDVLEEQ
ncbi:hypothetical protein Tco_1448991 [Tanacetum coccineum]